MVPIVDKNLKAMVVMDESTSPISSLLENIIYSFTEEKEKVSHPLRQIRHLVSHTQDTSNHNFQLQFQQHISSISPSIFLTDDDLLFSSSFSAPSSSIPILGNEDTSLDYQMPSNYNNYTNITYDDYLPNNDSTIHFSVAFQIIIYIIYNTVFVAALLGNILVCYVVFSSPRMRTVTNYLIANLAIGDLLMALLCVPFSYISLLLQYWPFGQVLCHLVAPAQAVCVFVSAYTLVALAGDRYVAILYPLKPRLRRSQAVIVIFLVWVIAIVTSMPIAVFTKHTYNEKNGLPECQEMWSDEHSTYRLIYGLALMALQYFFPLAVLIFTYTRIALAVWGKKAPGEAEDGRDQRLAKAKRKMIKMMLAVVIVYTGCWLPFNILNVYSDFDGTIWEWTFMRYAFPIVQWLALAHTVCNPIIYCWMNSRFRAGFHSAISNVPFLKKITFGHSSQSQQEYRLQRLNTCTTYTFVSGNGLGGKLGRNSSLLSNGRKGSPPSFVRTFSNTTSERERHQLNRNSTPPMSVFIPLSNYPNNGSSSNHSHSHSHTSRHNIRQVNNNFSSPGNINTSIPIVPTTSNRGSSSQNDESFM